MSYHTTGATTISNSVTTVDCQKQVRSWRLLRSLMEFLIPSCNCTFVDDPEIKQEEYLQRYNSPKSSFNTSSSVITGTIFGYRRGKVSFCIQTGTKSSSPVLILELAVPTTVLAREMQGGNLRIALECTTQGHANSDSQSLLSMPVWTMYCNGRKVGFAVRRIASRGDVEALKLLSSVVVGAGVIKGNELGRDDELMYLRASFNRVCGSSHSESFHLIDPEGNTGQELSIFFFRST